MSRSGRANSVFRFLLNRALMNPPRGEDYATTLHAMAHMRVIDQRVQTKLIANLTHNVELFNPHGVSWSLFSLGVYDAQLPRVIFALCTRGLSMRDRFNLTEVAHAVEGLGRLYDRRSTVPELKVASRFVSALEDRVLTMIDWTQEDGVTAAGAITAFGIWGRCRPSVLHILLNKLVGRTDNVSTGSITGAVTSAMKLKVVHSDLVQEAMRQILIKGDDTLKPLSPGQVSKMWKMLHVVPLAKSDVVEILPRLFSATLKNLNTFTSKEYLSVFIAIANYYSRIALSCATEIREIVTHFFAMARSGRDISMNGFRAAAVLEALSRMGQLKDPHDIATLVNIVSIDMPKFDAIAVRTTLLAVTKIQLQNATLIHNLTKRLESVAGESDKQTVFSCLHCFFRLKVHVEKTFSALMARAHALQETFVLRDMLGAAHSCAAHPHHPACKELGRYIVAKIQPLLPAVIPADTMAVLIKLMIVLPQKNNELLVRLVRGQQVPAHSIPDVLHAMSSFTLQVDADFTELLNRAVEHKDEYSLRTLSLVMSSLPNSNRGLFQKFGEAAHAKVHEVDHKAWGVILSTLARYRVFLKAYQEKLCDTIKANTGRMNTQNATMIFCSLVKLRSQRDDTLEKLWETFSRDAGNKNVTRSLGAMLHARWRWRPLLPLGSHEVLTIESAVSLAIHSIKEEDATTIVWSLSRLRSTNKILIQALSEKAIKACEAKAYRAAQVLQVLVEANLGPTSHSLLRSIAKAVIAMQAELDSFAIPMVAKALALMEDGVERVELLKVFQNAIARTVKGLSVSDAVDVLDSLSRREESSLDVDTFLAITDVVAKDTDMVDHVQANKVLNAMKVLKIKSVALSQELVRKLECT